MGVTTRIAKTEVHAITVRGLDLVRDIIGEMSFTQMQYFLCTGRKPTPAQERVLDACLVTLMEHGWTPSSIIARLMADSVPDQTQVAIGAGLLAMGPVFGGTSEACARILQAGVKAGGDLDAYCRQVVTEHRSRRAPLPGFGHPLHKPEDPRTAKLLAVGQQAGVTGPHIELLLRLARTVDEVAGKHIPVNATGAMGALLLEIGLEPGVMRGLAVVSRSAGLIGHVEEERSNHAARHIWEMAEHNIPYEE